MANYPGADPSFGTKNSGNVIEASHINALQDEVVAIGSALRATQQHNIATAGSVTASSMVTANGQPRCAVYSTVSSTVTSSAFVAFTFESQEFSVGGMHSTAANSSAVTIGSSGTYALNARLFRNPGGSSAVTATILVNGGSVDTVYSTSPSGSLRLTHHARLQANDVVTLAVMASDTTGTPFNSGASGTETRLEVVRLY
jgi:hypothetical protein